MADASTPTRCYWLREEDGIEILIPMCIGAAIGGPAECTCNVPESRIETTERGRAEAERQVLRLMDERDRRLEAQAVTWRENKRLRQWIEDLETQLTKEDKMATLHLPLKGAYFDQIKSGEKIEEYRLATPFWAKRLEGLSYDRIEIAKGYPLKGDTGRRITRPWRGFRKTTITHPHFGPDPVEVYAIRVN